MIRVIISEKGGAERRNVYNQNEVSIGRVKGNDVLLPKGNVSKRHARLIVRDGRYIVTDLKSTNGTYVNHRRITHATLVREGDRIYIGDFVLRIETGNGVMDEAVTAMHGPDSGPGSEFRGHVSGERPSLASVDGAPSGSGDDVISHFPIENDPDSDPSLEVPGPPRMPTGVTPRAARPIRTTSEIDQAALTHDSYVGPPLESDPGRRVPRRSDPATSESKRSTDDPRPSEPSPPPSQRLRGTREPITGGSGPVLPSSQPGTDPARRASHKAALEALLEAVQEGIDMQAVDAAVTPDAALIEKVELALDEHLAKAVADGLPEGLEPEALQAAARRELLEVGPIGPLLDDPAITEVKISLGEVTIARRGRRSVSVGFDFSSERAVARALHRLCARAVEPRSADGPHLEVRLSEGVHLSALRPPATVDGSLVVIRRVERPQVTLNGLVRSGVVSRSMATFLGHCVAARANLLIAGPAESGKGDIVEALATALRSARPLELTFEGAPHVEGSRRARVVLPQEPAARARCLEAAMDMRADMVLVPPVSGATLLGVLDGVARGADGVMMQVHAPTMRAAWTRLASDLAAARAGLSAETAREWLAGAFDIGVEVARLRDDRLRVVRLVELRDSARGASLRELFNFAYHRTAAGGSIEGSFYATGHVPRIAEDMAARGMPLDSSIFRRHPSG